MSRYERGESVSYLVVHYSFMSSKTKKPFLSSIRKKMLKKQFSATFEKVFNYNFMKEIWKFFLFVALYTRNI